MASSVIDGLKGIEGDIRHWKNEEVPLSVIAVRIIQREAVRLFIREQVSALAIRREIADDISTEDLYHDVLARLIQYFADENVALERTGSLKRVLKRMINDQFFDLACKDLSLGVGQTNSGRILERLVSPGTHEDFGRLFTCIADLDDESRSLILMKYFGVQTPVDEPRKMTNDMIAKHLRIDIRTVHRRHTKAIAKLRSLLDS